MKLPHAIGPYEIVRRLGRGGMAETFLGIRRGTDGFQRQVCVKRIHPHAADDETMRLRFVQEAKVLSALRHSAIVMAEDAGFDPDQGHYFVMEYVDGINLDEILGYCEETGALFPVDAATYLIATVAEALHHGHTLEVDGIPTELVHRDVSPMNLLVDLRGYVKLIDFGISLLQGAAKFTATNTMPGNARFLSPEHRWRKELDPRSDLYALGIVAHLILTGVHPFDDGSDDKDLISEAILEGTPLDPKHLDAADLPPVLTELVKQLLQPEKAARPASGDHVAAKLDGAYRPYVGRVQLSQLAASAKEHAAARAAAMPSQSEASAGHELATRREARAVTTSAAKVRARALKRAGALAVGATLAVALAVTLSSRMSPSSSRPKADATIADAAPQTAPATGATERVPPLPIAPTSSNPAAPMAPAPRVDAPGSTPGVSDAAAGAATPAPSTEATQLASLNVRAFAGCIVLDDKKRAVDTLTARNLAPGPHRIGLAPDCKSPIAEEHAVSLRPGKNNLSFPYSGGIGH